MRQPASARTPGLIETVGTSKTRAGVIARASVSARLRLLEAVLELHSIEWVRPIGDRLVGVAYWRGHDRARGAHARAWRGGRAQGQDRALSDDVLWILLVEHVLRPQRDAHRLLAGHVEVPRQLAIQQAVRGDRVVLLRPRHVDAGRGGVELPSLEAI